MKTAKAKLILIALLLLFAPAIYAITGNNSDNYTHVGTITSIVANTTTEDYTGRISAGQHPASTFNNSNSTTGRFGILDDTGLTAPSLYSPSNNQTIFDLTPTFIWNNSIDPNYNTITYQLQVDDTSDFSSALEVNITDIEETTTQTSKRISTELTTDKTYYWRVRANDGLNDGPYSDTFSFNLDSNTAITLITDIIEFGVLSPGNTNQTFPDNTSSVIHKQYLILDGDNDYIDTGKNTSLSPTDELTISAWVNINNSGTNPIISKNTGENNRSWDLSILSDGSIRAISYINDNASNTITSSGIINTNIWYHIAYTAQNNSQIVYVNGVQRSNSTASGQFNISSAGTKIGNSLTNYFNGSIDEAIIYNRSLAPSEIVNLYIHGSNNSLHNNTNSMIAHWSFEQNATDSSGKKNDGTLYGNTRFSTKYVDPFILENQGNVFVNISIRSTSLFSSVSLNTTNFQYRPDDRFEIMSYFLSQSIGEYTNMKSSDELAVRLLSFRNETDSSIFDIKVRVPDDEPAGIKTATVTFTAEKS